MSKSSNSTTGVILLKLLLSVPFFFLLYTLKENHSDDRLAVLSALKNDRHSLRIFRGFAEVCLLIFCTAICIKVLDESLGKEMVSVLLFGEAQKEDDNEVFVKDTSGDYRLVSAAPIDGIEENEPTTLINDLHPSTSRIASSGMDMILLLSISLLLFTINSDYTSKYSHLSFPFLPSSVFPLTLFFLFLCFIIFPWNRRRTFLLVVWRTLEAPFRYVTFRDGLVGDILTSTVRPMQDIAYSFFYLFSGLNGGIDSSTILYAFVLPACAVTPLWLRFLQCLRQSHDLRKRWPYLGNAFKYFVAAEVALFGLFVPNNKDKFIWRLCFVIATLYQIWWDTFMDWELFQYDASTRTYSLRTRRLYSYRFFYYFIFTINFLLRFCWTLSFIPPQTLSRAGLVLDTFSAEADFKNLINPALASAEIIRRSLWALIRIELQAIKMLDQSITTDKETDILHPDQSSSSAISDDDLQEMLPMEIENSANDYSTLLQQPFAMFQTKLSLNSEIQVLSELVLYSTAFTSLGILAAAHRE